MQCEVYKGSKKSDTYIYMAAPADFSLLPESIVSYMGPLTLALALNVEVDTKLAKEKASEVLKNIEERGFHIQLPPKDSIDNLV